ncbi:MAG: phosphoribosylglycinamide formyltransferase 1 [Actinomycetota bacterium]|nr:phosphoribosylglycinamide formyltransferase 1 [Actinomycetota bacterium]
MVALRDACERGEIPGELVAVVADRPCDGIALAREAGIDTVVIEPGDFASRDEWSAGLKQVVGSFEPDLVVSAGFMRILAPVFVDAFAGRLLNLHPSLLPSFPGAHAVRDAIAFGARVTGSTVHFIDNEVDHGPIVAQTAVEIEPGDSEDELHERIKAAEHKLLPDACRLVIEGRARLEGSRVVFSGGR